MARRGLFAEQPLQISKLPSFRAEHFPYSGPYPWLDQPDASDRIESKLRQGEIDGEEAAQCRYWAANGYIVLRALIADPVLDAVWEAYEKAIGSGRIALPPDQASPDDPYPGRFLNPHKKIGAFCRILSTPACCAGFAC